MGQYEIYQILKKHPNRWMGRKDFEAEGMKNTNIATNMRKLAKHFDKVVLEVKQIYAGTGTPNHLFIMLKNQDKQISFDYEEYELI